MRSKQRAGREPRCICIYPSRSLEAVSLFLLFGIIWILDRGVCSFTGKLAIVAILLQSFMDEDDEDEESVPPQSQSYEEPTRRPRRNTRSGKPMSISTQQVPLRSISQPPIYTSHFWNHKVSLEL